MNRTNKKAPQVKSAKQQLKQPMARPQSFTPAVAQAKNAGPAANVRRPVAPPVYKPQANPNAVQQTAGQLQMKTQAAAPPPYRPQPAPRITEVKAAHSAGSSPGRTVARVPAKAATRSPKRASAVQMARKEVFVKTLTGKTIFFDVEPSEEKKDVAPARLVLGTGLCSCGSNIPYKQCHGQNKVGRNELCPCGSGEKYKKCHGVYYAL